MDHKKMRVEFSNQNFRNELNKKYLKICSNCGSDKEIEFHHIVPLINGGTNAISNIVPLCEECHFKAHEKIYKTKKTKSGRPKKVLNEEQYKYLKMYFEKQIGKKEAMEKTKVKGNTTWSKITNQYKKQNGIVNFKNDIDIKNAQTKRLESLFKNNNL